MEKKVAIVTGGASGLGENISRYLASKNCDLILTYHESREKAESLKKELEEKHRVNILLKKCNLEREEDIKEVVSIVKENYQSIDYLVNNAAICLDTLFENKNKDNFMKTLEVNVVGTFLMSKLIGQMMYDKKKGSIVNLSSTNGIDKYYPMSIDYDASKAAINSITHNLSLAFSPYVRVNAVAPGWVKTEKEMKELDLDYIKSEEDKIFLKRFGECEEISKVIYFLLSDDASYINNQVIRVDGGTY